MGYLTETKLSNTLDVPISLPTTEIKMGDWMVLSTISIVAPTQVTYRMLNLSFSNTTVPLTNILAANLIVPNFGLCYVGMYYNYTSGDPSGLSTLDILSTNALGVISRTATPVVTTQPGTYSWIAVNNVQFSSQNALLTISDSADFTINVVGQARIELDL
jgi:hypothetical protein